MAIEITTAEKRLLQRVSIPPRPETLLTVSREAKKVNLMSPLSLNLFRLI